MKQIFPSASVKSGSGARKESFPNVLSCPVVVCLFVHFLLSFLSVGGIVSPAIKRLSHRLLCNKTPIPSSTTESTEKQLLTKENTGITCLLRIC